MNAVFKAPQRGFTLLEVVVALSLLSLLLLAVTAAFRGLAQTSAHLERNTLASEDMRAVSALLQRTVGMAATHPNATAADGSTQIRFEGRPDALTWLAPLPAREGVGGLTHLSLRSERLAGTTALALRIVPYSNFDPQAVPAGLFQAGAIAAEPDWSLLPPRPLVEALTGLEIRYRGHGESDWQTHWHDTDTLPAHVMFALQTDGRDWPPLVIALAAATPRTDVTGTRNGQAAAHLAGSLQ